MTKEPVTVAPSVSLRNAYALMRSRKIRRLPVVEADRLIGIVTLTDMTKLLFVGEGGTNATAIDNCTVREFMTEKPETAGPNDPIEKAALLMYRRGVSSLPIVDDGKLVGIITETDIFKAFITIMGIDEEGTRIVLELKSEDTGFQEIMDCVEEHGVDLLSIATLHTYSRTHTLAVIRVKGFETDSFTEDIRDSGFRVLEIS
ncbi:MAG: CBS domain-containing protein [Planctomycetota bacterium]